MIPSELIFKNRPLVFYNKNDSGLNCFIFTTSDFYSENADKSENSQNF